MPSLKRIPGIAGKVVRLTTLVVMVRTFGPDGTAMMLANLRMIRERVISNFTVHKRMESS